VESGAQIDVSATATDADSGQTLTYAWTTTSGSFVTPTSTGIASGTSVATQYVCGAPGAQTVTVTVTDSYQPTGCSTQMTFPVTCVAAGVCGNMIVEAGEQCDPPSAANHCSATCQNIPFCGDGHVDPGEQCDPPNGTTCSATCQTQAFCGDGIVTPPENCEPPNTMLPNGDLCNAQCMEVVQCTSNACITCEMSDTADCLASLNIVPGGTGCYGCEGFPPGSASRADCLALYSCIRTSNCMNGDITTPCLCGTLTSAQCVAQGPPATAACAMQYAKAAADTSSLGPAFQQTMNPNSPVGIANNLATCAVDSAANPSFMCVCQ
jgi:cysteine-rich repeat protein